MTVSIIQTCDRCSKTRPITDKTQREYAGWRLLNDKDICVDCIKKFLEDVDG